MYKELTDDELDEAFAAVSMRVQDLLCHREESPTTIGYRLYRNASNVLNLIMDEIEYRMEDHD